MRKRFALSLLLLILPLGGILSAQDTDNPTIFPCPMDESCPEVFIEGDPHAVMVNGVPAPFRGYGDPSLEYDLDSGVLWLSYSWLDTLITDPDGPLINFGVETHLARSDDNGQTFTFVSQVNAMQHVEATDVRPPSWLTHEVSTITRQPDGSWQMLYLSYFAWDGRVDEAGRDEFHLRRTVADNPEDLGTEEEIWASGWALVGTVTPRYNLSTIPGLEDCAVISEPALFTHEDTVYLATNCLVVERGEFATDRSRIVLLRDEADGYALVGVLVDHNDSQMLGVELLDQVDLTYARDGHVIMVVAGLDRSEMPRQKGCMAIEVEDITQAQIRRNEDGSPYIRAMVVPEGENVGVGLCTYDPHSEAGMLVTINYVDLERELPEVFFSLRATGVHP